MIYRMLLPTVVTDVMRSLNINLICINVYIPSHPPLYKKVTYFIFVNLFLNVHEPRVVVGIQRDT
jgi:hypothetical protein